MEKIKGINIEGRETVSVPISLFSLAKIAEKIRAILVSDGLEIDDDGEYIIQVISHISQGAINSDELIDAMREEMELDFKSN